MLEYNEFQDWVISYENLYELEIVNLTMDHPEVWETIPGYYPHLVGCVEE